MPSLVVSTGKTVLYTSSGKRLPFAFPGWRLPLTLVAMRSPTEAMVKLTGGMEVYGLTAISEMGVLVCSPGPLGAHFYAGDGNMLRLRSVVRGGQVTVAGVVTLRLRDHDKKLTYGEQFRRLPFEAGIKVERLCKSVPGRKHTGTGKDPHIIRTTGEVHKDDLPAGMTRVYVEKGENPPLRATPGGGGKVLHLRRADRWGYSLYRLEQKDGWDRVVAGSGPYLLGWIPTRPEYNPKSIGIGSILGTMGKSVGPANLRTKALRAYPLHRLSPGTPMQQFGVVHARLLKPGFARVITRKDKWIYVAAAVDRDVKVEGWIEAASLGEKVE